MAVSCLTYQPMVPCYEKLTFSVVLPPPSFPDLDDDDDDDEPMAVQVLDDNEIETSTPDQKTTKSGHAELTFSVIFPPPSFPNLDEDDDDEPMAAQVLGGRSPSLFSPRKRKFSDVFRDDEAETGLLRNTKKPRLAGPDVATVVETQEEVVPKTKRRPWTSVPKESNRDKKQHAPMDARFIIKAMRSKKANLSRD